MAAIVTGALNKFVQGVITEEIPGGFPSRPQRRNRLHSVSLLSALYVCLMCLSYISALCVCLMCLPYVSVLYVCLMCLPYVSALCVCPMCLPYMAPALRGRQDLRISALNPMGYVPCAAAAGIRGS